MARLPCPQLLLAEPLWAAKGVGVGVGAEPSADRELILLFLGRAAGGALVSEQGWGALRLLRLRMPRLNLLSAKSGSS